MQTQKWPIRQLLDFDQDDSKVVVEQRPAVVIVPAARNRGNEQCDDALQDLPYRGQIRWLGNRHATCRDLASCMYVVKFKCWNLT
jgi:hypothetical protein